jgi:hypothetical protein
MTAKTSAAGIATSDHDPLNPDARATGSDTAEPAVAAPGQVIA